MIECRLCGFPIEPRQPFLQRVQGWLRPQGTGGGQIVKRERVDVFAHRACVEHGIPEARLW